MTGSGGLLVLSCSVLRLPVRDGSLEDLVTHYCEAGIVEAAVPYGVLHGEVVHARTDPRELVVCSVWRTSGGVDAWYAAPERARFVAALDTFLTGPATSQHHTVETTREALADPLDLSRVLGCAPVAVRHTVLAPELLEPDHGWGAPSR